MVGFRRAWAWMLAAALVAAAWPAGAAPAAAPAGGRIAFVDAGAVWTIEPDGSALRRIRAGVRDPAFSPDGAWLAVTGADGLEVMRPDAAAPRRVTRAARPYGDAQPAWSPSGRYLAFTRLLPGYRNPELFRVDLRTGALRRLTRTSGIAEGHPSWSPNGLEIVFAQARLNVRFAPSSLWEVRPDGAGLRRLATLPALQPSWSPDGTTIAFSSAATRKQDLWTLKDDGTRPADLTAAFAGANVEPSWSPDDGAIVFASTHGNPTDLYDLWVLPPDGAPRRLTSFGTAPGGSSAVTPTWQRAAP